MISLEDLTKSMSSETILTGDKIHLARFEIPISESEWPPPIVNVIQVSRGAPAAAPPVDLSKASPGSAAPAQETAACPGEK